MKLLAATLIALSGLAALSVPAAAQSNITVFGGAGLYDAIPEPRLNDSTSSYRYAPNFDAGGRFDPAQAAINAINVSKFHIPRNYVTFNVERALTLNATGESIAEHWERCAVLYDTYDPVSNTYYGSDGLPVACR